MAKRSRKQTAVAAKQRKKLALDDKLNLDWNKMSEDVDYENLTRHFEHESSDDEALPVIVKGKVHKVKASKVKQVPSESQSESGEEEEGEEGSASTEAEEESEEEPELTLAQLKEKVALSAELLNESPEEHVLKLKDLLQLAAHTRKAKSRQVLLLSLLTIFKDVLPGYRVQALTDAQKREKVTKEVRQLRDYEQALLRYYLNFVTLLGTLYRQGKTEESGNKYVIASTCVNIVCDLLESVPFFNYRSELVSLLVEKLSSQRIDTSFIRAIECVQKIFEEDFEGHISFELVQQIAKMIKRRSYRVDSRVVATFTHLRLLTDLVGRADLEKLIKEKPEARHIKKKERVHLTKKERKARKDQKEIDEEMRKAETRVSNEMREKLQAQSLKVVFVLYFNILKAKSKNLTGVTLEGLAQFTHLINADLFGDLLEVLRQIVNEQNQTNNRESLLCVCTAFALLNGQGKRAETMNLDLTFFVNLFYKVLMQMALDPHIEQSHKHLQSIHRGKMASETDMLMRAFEAIFTKRINISQQRAMAFTKRLGICSLNFPEKTSLIAFNILEQIIKRHPQVKALLFTQDRVVKGRYSFEADVPEHSNPEVSTMWELSVMARHYNPNVSLAARQVRNLTE